MDISTSCYLLVLAVEPAKEGQEYPSLPLHCTLMHWFWSGLPLETLAEKIRPIFAACQPIDLVPEGRLALGPLHLMVNKVQLTSELQAVHVALYDALNESGVTYTAPQWVGDGFNPHVTDQGGRQFQEAGVFTARVAYLAQADGPEYENTRRVVAQFDLANCFG